MFKNNSFVLLKPLTHIFNSSISKSVFPDMFKTAIVIPVFKKGNRDDVKNYRSISLISNVAKIFEK